MDAIRGRPADPETHLLWNAIAHLCPAGPPPCAAIARRTGLPDATVSDWFRNRYVPPWERFTRLLEYFPPAERGRLTDLWTAAWRARQTRARSESPQPAPARIAHLPHDITDFTGRRREVRTLADLILDPPNDVGLPIVVVQGMAGAGKTRLAVHVLRRLNVSAGEVQLYVDLGGFSARREPVDPAAALAGLLRLGTPDAEIPSDLDARAALYRDRLDGRHAVVLLDNALSAEQVRPLVPGSPTCRVLVTSRRSLDGLDGTRHLRLGVFDTDEALALLSAIVGAERVAAEEDAALRVVELTGRLPLAVSLVARRLRARPSWRLADVAVLLEAEESRLSRLASDDVAVRAAFAVSYELLADGHRRLFRRLASLPGRDFCVHAAAAVAAVPVPDAAEILEALLDEHLLDDAGLGRYGWHDLVALFARERFLADEDAAARDIAVRRGLESYLLTADRARRIAQPHYRQLATRPGLARTRTRLPASITRRLPELVRRRTAQPARGDQRGRCGRSRRHRLAACHGAVRLLPRAAELAGLPRHPCHRARCGPPPRRRPRRRLAAQLPRHRGG